MQMRRCRHRIVKLRGSAMVETLVALPVLITLIAGLLQVALLYEAKHMLNHAVLQAARYGAVNNADPEHIINALARALLPLYSPDMSVAGLLETLTLPVAKDVRGFTDIRILNPTQEAFADFAVSNGALREIPNDALATRPATLGVRSGISIQDANLLKLQVRYGHQLKVPLVRWVFRGVLGLKNQLTGTGDAVDKLMLANNRIPIMSTVIVRMQTPAQLSRLVVARAQLPVVPRSGAPAQ